MDRNRLGKRVEETGPEGTVDGDAGLVQLAGIETTGLNLIEEQLRSPQVRQHRIQDRTADARCPATGAVAGLVAIRPFFGAPSPAAQKAHEGPWPLWLGPMTLALLGGSIGYSLWRTRETPDAAFSR